MLKPLKNYFLDKLVAASLYLLNQKYPITDFITEVGRIKKILIILPATAHSDKTVQDFMTNLQKEFPHSQISTFDTSMLRKNDVNWLQVPNKEYLNHIRQEEFDLLIDINFEHDRICTYLGALSNAPMRIHLAEGRFDNVYNLCIRTGEDTPLNIRFETLINYLSQLNKAASLKS